MSRMLSTIVSVALMVVATGAGAQIPAPDWSNCTGHVTMIESSSIGSISTDAGSPAAVYFMLDVNVGTICSGSGTTQCASGQWLRWVSRYYADSAANELQRELANTRGVLSALQLAQATGTKVTVNGLNASGGMCQLTNVYTTLIY
jgi:hypothetical protein